MVAHNHCLRCGNDDPGAGDGCSRCGFGYYEDCDCGYPASDGCPRCKQGVFADDDACPVCGGGILADYANCLFGDHPVWNRILNTFPNHAKAYQLRLLLDAVMHDMPTPQSLVGKGKGSDEETADYVAMLFTARTVINQMMLSFTEL